MFGFLRLRLLDYSTNNTVFPELSSVALIRELHVYGRTVSGDAVHDDHTPVAQHTGIGRRLLLEAERLSNGYNSIAVISGVGVQNYYARMGYALRGPGEFMMKELTSPFQIPCVVLMVLLIIGTCIGVWQLLKDKI